MTRNEAAERVQQTPDLKDFLSTLRETFGDGVKLQHVQFPDGKSFGNPKLT